MYINTVKDGEDLIYQSYVRAVNHITVVEDEKVKRPELTRRLLDLVGSPDKGGKFILVTGSKGKGSTSRFISSLLSHLGFKVGLFTSPHLVDFNERIRIDGKAISDRDFIRIANEVKTAVDEIEEDIPIDDYQGPIGIALAIAARYFKENDTDINVIECGRGGRYDDTNVLNNEWAVITPIMEEHMANLGPTLEHIVIHKLGIVKQKTKHVYINKQSDAVSTSISQKLSQQTSNSFYKQQFSADNVMMSSTGTSFDIRTKRATYTNLNIPLLGEFQAVNAAVAVQLCEDIINKKISETLLKSCFQALQWPGRCEIIGLHPTVILDGAINESTANQVNKLVKVLSGNTKPKISTIISVPANKDYEGVIRALSDISSQIIVTVPDRSHLPFPEDALLVAKKYHSNSQEYANLEKALEVLKRDSALDIILIVGTQQFIGNAKRLFGHSLLDIGK